jgi:hypothetical protein
MWSPASHLIPMSSTIISTPLLASAAVGGATFFLIAYLDYRHYCSLGDHGLPGNFYGWRKQLQMSRKARKDTIIPAPYNLDEVAKEYGPHALTSFVEGPLLAREGVRPKIPGFVVPQRQITKIASPAMKERMFAYLESLVRANSTVLQSELSRLEGPVPAVQLLSFLIPPPFLKSTRGEITHIHPPDGSTHLVLSLEDSRFVIEKGWGQRHRLSGGGMLPWSYTLVYAPRDEGEFDVWKGIVVAAARFCCAELREIKGVKE